MTDPLAAARSETIEWVLRHDKLEAENAELRASVERWKGEYNAACDAEAKAWGQVDKVRVVNFSLLLISALIGLLLGVVL